MDLALSVKDMTIPKGIIVETHRQTLFPSARLQEHIRAKFLNLQPHHNIRFPIEMK